jgi:hypothetical protein
MNKLYLHFLLWAAFSFVIYVITFAMIGFAASVIIKGFFVQVFGPEILVRLVLIDVTLNQLIEYIVKSVVYSASLLIFIGFAVVVNVNVVAKLLRRTKPRLVSDFNTVTGRFLAASSSWRRVYLASGALFALGSLSGFVGERGAAIVCVCLGLIVIAHRFITELRVVHGYFGGNAEEAVELIEFILKEKNGGTPPGSRISRPYAQRHRSAGVAGRVAPTEA